MLEVLIILLLIGVWVLTSFLMKAYNRIDDLILRLHVANNVIKDLRGEISNANDTSLGETGKSLE